VVTNSVGVGVGRGVVVATAAGAAVHETARIASAKSTLVIDRG
jgi:hypothetical protein